MAVLKIVFYFIMSCIDIKALKSLIKMGEKSPGYERTILTFNQQFYFRTTLKINDYDHLAAIAEKINLRHRRNEYTLDTLRDYKPTKFGNSQLKLFSWVVVLYCHYKEVLLQKLVLSYTIQSEEDYLRIQAIFCYVEIPRIIYEIKCFCYTKGQIETAWTEEETLMFENLVVEKNASEWKNIAYQMFKRSDCRFFRFFEQYREKWINYLNPQLDKGKWTIDDSIRMVGFVISLGKRWAAISREFNCMRSEHTVKNHYKKLLRQMAKSREGEVLNESDLDQVLLDELLRRKSLASGMKLEEASESKIWIKLQKTNESGEQNSSKGEQGSKNQEILQKPDSNKNPTSISGYIFYPRATPVPSQPCPESHHSPPHQLLSEGGLFVKEEDISCYDYKMGSL